MLIAFLFEHGLMCLISYVFCVDSVRILAQLPFLLYPWHFHALYWPRQSISLFSELSFDWQHLMHNWPTR